MRWRELEKKWSRWWCRKGTDSSICNYNNKYVAVVMSFLIIASSMAAVVSIIALPGQAATSEPDSPDSSTCCFPAGTKISMADGSLKNIEDVEVGNRVLSYDVDKKEIVETSVAKLTLRIREGLYEINDGMISSTDDHPFYVRKPDGRMGWAAIDPAKSNVMYGYRDAIPLEVGDELLTVDGDFIEIESIVFRPGIIKTYTFTVDSDVHDYFANNVLVSNAIDCGTLLCCFPAGTKISMADRSIENIEDIEVGDVVLSYDVEQQEIVESSVDDLTVTLREGVYEINGELVSPTDDHPLYVRKPDGHMGWAAIDPAKSNVMYGYRDPMPLEIGDELLTIDGQFIKIESIVFRPGIIKTFTFTIDSETHDYFANGVLVSNAIERCEIDDGGGGGCTVTDTTYSKSCYGGDVYWYDNCGGRQSKYAECGSTSSWSDTGSTRWVATSSYSATGDTRWVSDGSECSQKQQEEQSRNEKEQKQQSRVVRGCSSASCYANTEYQWVDTGNGRVVLRWVDTGSTRDNDALCPSDTYVDTGSTKWVFVSGCQEKEQKQQRYKNYYCSGGSCTSSLTSTYRWVDTGRTRDVDSYCPSDAYEDSSPLETQWISDGSECGEKEQKKQYLRNHYCSGGSCTSSLTSTSRWVDTGNTRDVDDYCPADAYVDTGSSETTPPTSITPSGTFKVGQTISISAAGGIHQKQQEYRDYSCSHGSCSYTGGSYRWVETGNSISYKYKFVRSSDGSILQNYGNGANLVIPQSVAHDNIKVYVIAYYGSDESTAYESSNLAVLNSAPSINAIADQSVNEGASLSFDMNYNDADGDTVTFDVDASDGEIINGDDYKFVAGYDNNHDNEDVPVTIAVNDGYGGTDSESFTISVSDVNRAPAASFDHSKAVDPVADAIVINNSKYVNFSDTSSDPDGDSLTRTWKIFNTDGSVLLRAYKNAAENLNYTFNVSGTFRVLLHVDDGYTGGALDTTTVTIKVKQKIRKVPAPGKNIVRIPWMNGETTTADLISQFNLRTYDTIKIQNRTTGLFNQSINMIDDTSAYKIKPGDVLVVVLNNETSKTDGIDVTLDPSIDRATSINTTILTEEAAPKNEGGYNYLTWLPENSTTASDLASELNLQPNQLIAKYNDDTGSYDTAYIVGLPFLDYTINPGDMICIKAKFADADTMKEASMTYTDTTVRTALS